MKELFNQNQLHFESVFSTNEVLLEMAEKNQLEEGFVLTSSYQQLGKGQREKKWESELDKNLLISFLLYPKVELAEQFKLNQFVSLALSDCLSRYMVEKVNVKWPNDILINDKKIAGILIENKIQKSIIKQSVIGVGLNINQQRFESYNFKPTSLSLELDRYFSIEEVKENFLFFLQSRYNQFKSNDKLLQFDYQNLLYLKDEDAEFLLKKQKKRAVIKGVNNEGCIQMLVDGKKENFQSKDVEYMF